MANLNELLTDLCGQAPAVGASTCGFPPGGLGLSQFNELLLSQGFDRVSEPFFAYFASRSSTYAPGTVIPSIVAFADCVERFQIHALRRFGNIRHAFKSMARMDQEAAENEIEWDTPWSEERYTARHKPLHAIEPIEARMTYLLGYLVDRQIEELAGVDESRSEAQALQKQRDEVREIGEHNHQSYLASDHMDVYVATSMREPHEYLAVNRIACEIFAVPELAKLRPRYFDPTQAFCRDRIDKGLAEALMLKRAKCTIYLAQESDTLGKDSELASTLAQGKPVIAFVPKYTPQDAKRELEFALGAPRIGTPPSTRAKAILDHAMLIEPKEAWTNERIRDWLSDPESANESEVEAFATELMRRHYDKRADTLKERHPLGIQVHLDSGVANGVLVARSVAECAELVRRVMTNSLEFRIDRKTVADTEYLLLRESVTDSVFRVVTGDAFLTNAFWNYYNL